jgi:hypothetical protein
MAMAAVAGSAVMQLCNNAWLTGSAVAPVRPVRTRPRRNQLRKQGEEDTKRLRLTQQLRQLGDIRRDPPRLVFAEHFGNSNRDVPLAGALTFRGSV